MADRGKGNLLVEPRDKAKVSPVATLGETGDGEQVAEDEAQPRKGRS